MAQVRNSTKPKPHTCAIATSLYVQRMGSEHTRAKAGVEEYVYWEKKMEGLK